jgi:hypothetical protein
MRWRAIAGCDDSRSSPDPQALDAAGGRDLAFPHPEGREPTMPALTRFTLTDESKRTGKKVVLRLNPGTKEKVVEALYVKNSDPPQYVWNASTSPPMDILDIEYTFVWGEADQNSHQERVRPGYPITNMDLNTLAYLPPTTDVFDAVRVVTVDDGVQQRTDAQPQRHRMYRVDSLEGKHGRGRRDASSGPPSSKPNRGGARRPRRGGPKK